ncbi:MAG: hypothetical protein R3B93_00305 [Bacteroidia bacterium]
MLNTRYFGIYNPQAPPLPNYAALGNAHLSIKSSMSIVLMKKSLHWNDFYPQTTAIVDQNIENGCFAKQLEGWVPSTDSKRQNCTNQLQT